MRRKKQKSRVIKSYFEALPFFVAAFAVGLRFSTTVPEGLHFFFFVVAMTAIFATFFLKNQPVWLLATILAGSISSGLFYGMILIDPPIAPKEYSRIEQTAGSITGTFIGEFKTLKGGAISLKLNNCLYTTSGQTIRIPVPVYCLVTDPGILPEPEQNYQASGTFKLLEHNVRPGFRTERLNPHLPAPAYKTWAGQARRLLRDGLKRSLSPRHAAITMGFVLGDTSEISHTDKKLFRDTGVSHVLAVSGQHIMILAILMAAILHWFGVPPISRSILISIFLIFYALVTPGAASIWRALTMYIATAATLHSEAFPAAVRPVSIAAFILLLYDPSMINSAAFQLSFSAVLAIIFLRKPVEWLLRKLLVPDFFIKYLGVSIAANLGTLPMTAFLFGAISLGGLLVNPAVLWLFAYILPVSFVVASLSAIWAEGALLLASGLSISIDLFIGILEYAARIPGITIYIGNPPGVFIAAIYASMLLLTGLWSRRQVEKALSLTDKASIRIKPSNKTPTEDIEQKTKPQVPLKQEPEIRREATPLKSAVSLARIDHLLSQLKRKGIKNLASDLTTDFPINLLNIDSQNLYYQLSVLDRNSLVKEPERLIQAHVYLMSLVGAELLLRITSHLNPPPKPSEVQIKHRVNDRNLANAILADLLLDSQLLTRATTSEFMLLASRLQSLYGRSASQLARIMQAHNFEESLEQHFSLRRDLMAWCREFIEFDTKPRIKREK